MQQTSALYQRILGLDNHWFETKVRIAGTDYSESMLMSVSTSSAMFAGNPEVGHAIAGEVDVSMIAPSIAIPRMAKVEPFVRVCAKIPGEVDVSIENGILRFGDSFTESGGIIDLKNYAKIVDGIVYFQKGYSQSSSEWLPMGVYYIDTRETTRNGDGLNILTIHGFDAMLFAEQIYPSTNHAWPMSDVGVVAEIAATMGVEVDSRTWNIMTGNYSIPLPSSYSMREVLGYIASMYVGSFVMTETGKLRLVTLLELPTETNYLIDNAGLAITFGGDRILV